MLGGELYAVAAAGDHWRLLRLQGKGIGASYQATADGCTCPDRQFRRHECKHMRALARLGLGVPAIAGQEAAARSEQ